MTQALRRLRADERGNIAMITTLAIIPLTVASLGAVDLTRTIAARVELQDALDAAALATGRSDSQDAAQLQALGERILKLNLSGASDFTLTSAVFTIGANNQIVASAKATFQPMLTSFSGGGPVDLAASTEVMRANSILEIAMVLDNTGSMGDTLGSGGSKLSYLKTAASSFIDTMAKASKQSTISNSIQISLVPFSNMVRVGSTYRNATWMDQSGVSPLNNEIFTTAAGVTQTGNRWAYFDKIDPWRGCVEMRKAPYDIQDTPPTSADPASLFTPLFAPDEQDEQNGNDYLKDPTKDANGNTLTTWWAVQGDTNKYLTVTAKPKPSGSKGPNAGCSLQTIQRLTTDFTALKSAVNSMTDGGETNIPNGLMWGWHTLSPNAPFADGVAYLTPKHKKIVVLMTDGDNTMSTKGGNNNSNYSAAGFVWQGRFLKADGTKLNAIYSSETDRTAAMDSRLKKLCANMKASSVDIEIYTVGVGVTTANKALLQACASGADHYFDVTAGSNLTSTFQSIANQISQLHLSK
ncbi:pilus assembly protein TadG-related protein [Phenylobacterium sp. LjRoot225]|uniref:TadE/TadG family type IV pilus assembly protein n=1 Tax=Phenylobacterium sp. LjRoot225 TaxID=3342285 RepID=UPI003ECC9C26